MIAHVEELTQDEEIQGIFIALYNEQEKVHRFTQKIESPVLMDKFRSIAKRHGVISYDGNVLVPKVFIIDQQGRVLAILEPDEVSGEEIRDILSKLR